MRRIVSPGLDIRPLVAADRDRLAVAFARLSAESRYQRFLGAKSVLSTADLDAMTQLDYISRDAIVAAERETGRLVGVARYAVDPRDRSAAEVAIVVADDWQGRGLGRELSRTLVCRAAGSGIARLKAGVLEDNVRSLALLRNLGFRARGRDGHVMEFALELGR